MRRRRRVLAAGLAVTAAALAAGGPRGAPAERVPAVGREASPPEPRQPASRHSVSRQLVSAPVRIADAGAVALLRPGDRVDVLSTQAGGEPRLLARAARVSQVPQVEEASGGTGEGALVVLSVPRDIAAALAGAGVSDRLAVVVC